MARLETDATMNLDDDDESVDVRWRPSPGALRNVVATLLVGALIAGAVYFFDRPGTANSQSFNPTASPQTAEPKIGKPAPNFVLTMTDGTKQQLSDFKGKPVWINFWASWCPPCRAENPDIQDVYNEHHDSDGLMFLAPALGEAADSVTSYMERADLHYPVGRRQRYADRCGLPRARHSDAHLRRPRRDHPRHAHRRHEQEDDGEDDRRDHHPRAVAGKACKAGRSRIAGSIGARTAPCCRGRQLL